MNFIKRISQRSYFAAGVGSRNRSFLSICVLLAGAGLLAQLNPLWSRRAQAEPAAGLRGEAAVMRLKADGGYASLMGALAAARNPTSASPGPDAAPNDSYRALPLTIDSNLTQQQKLTAPDAAAHDQFGGAVALSGDTAVVGAPFDDLNRANKQGSAYVFTRSGTGWSFQQKLDASDGAANDDFGGSVAIGGDTVVVGAQNDNVGKNGNQGAAYIFTRTNGVWTEQRKLTAADGAANDRFGGAVAISGNTVVVGAADDKIGANGQQGSTYVFVQNNGVWTQQQKLTANDGAAGDNLGGAVSISGDTVAVGAAHGKIGRNGNQGAVYIFTRGNGVWSEQKKLTAADGAANDQFGGAVTVSGDTVVAGAQNNNVGRNGNQGAAYVFARNGASWTERQKLTANDGAANDRFGVSVAISGDSVVVGAPNNNNGKNGNQGAAYVFTRCGANWTRQPKLTAADGEARDIFGSSVAISGDTVVAGAPNNGDAFTAQGAAYVFVLAANGHVQQQQFIAADGAAFDEFGFSVAVSGDTAVVGSWGDTVGANVAQGSAYVFTRSFASGGATWKFQQKLTASDGATRDLFGVSVAISGDVVVVGAFRADIEAEDQGAAYVFRRNGSVWTQQQKLMEVAIDALPFDAFGFSVAVSGQTVVVGAPGNGGSGGAYVYTFNGSSWRFQEKLIPTDADAGDNFGASVGVSGDTVVAGAPFDDIGANADQGSAYVFVRSNGSWTQQQKIVAGDGSAGENFGGAVALSGDTVVAGLAFDAIGAKTFQGSAYVFNRNNGVWTLQQKLTANDGAAGDDFGISVAISGDTIVVGSYLDTVGATLQQGSAYVFTRANGVWTQRQRLIANDGAALDFFGVSVAVSGDTIVVGSYSDDVGSNMNQGSAYVFASSPCPAAALNADEQ